MDTMSRENTTRENTNANREKEYIDCAKATYVRFFVTYQRYQDDLLQEAVMACLQKLPTDRITMFRVCRQAMYIEARRIRIYERRFVLGWKVDDTDTFRVAPFWKVRKKRQNNHEVRR